MPRRCWGAGDGGAGFALAADEGGAGDVDFDFDLGVAGKAGEDGRVVRSEPFREVPEVGGGPGSRARDGEGRTVAMAKAAAKAGVKRQGVIVRLH